jgi:hypothetical protein
MLYMILTLTGIGGILDHRKKDQFHRSIHWMTIFWIWKKALFLIFPFKNVWAVLLHFITSLLLL